MKGLCIERHVIASATSIAFFGLWWFQADSDVGIEMLLLSNHVALISPSGTKSMENSLFS
jgi:hypothetical protein